MKPGIVLRPARWLLGSRRRVVLTFAFTLLLLVLAHPGASASDVFGNISPAPQLPPGGWVGRYPVEHYSLDQYFPAISVGFTSGVDASGVAPMIAYFGAQVIWLITCFLANGVILLFALAFNLNLLTGNGTPGSGALTPISAAIHNLYTNTFGTPWLIAMVTLVGGWAMWKALVQRRYTETAGALAVSFIYFIIAIGIVTEPERTIAPASKLSNELSTALLSLTSEGSVGNESKAKTAASDQLFELLVLNPWTVLEFGGLEHCATVSHGKPLSVAVRPLSGDPAQDTQLASQLESGTEVKGEGGKVCVNNRNKYATHFLAYPFQSPNRNSEHEALEHGDTEDLPEADASKTSGTYTLGPADEPAAEAMGKGGQYQRLLLAFVILIGELGAYLLLGALALGVILAQILLLALLAFAPVALLIGIFPGRGHDFFRSWLAKLAGYLARKVVYSLILAVVLAVCSALDSATSNLGWFLAFALQAAFLWTIFLQRNRLTQDLLSGTVGPRAGEGTNRLANLYYASRLTRMIPLPRIRRGSGPDGGSESGGAGSESPSPGETPEGGGPPPAPGAGGSGEEVPPPPSGPGPHETPTHGPGAPAPGSSAAGEAQPASSVTPSPNEPPATAPQDAAAAPTRASTPHDHAASRPTTPVEDESPAATQRPAQPSSRQTGKLTATRDADPAEAREPTPTATSTGGASGTVMQATPSRPSAERATTTETPAVSPPPQTPEPSRVTPAGDFLAPDSAVTQTRREDQTNETRGTAPPPAVEAAIPAEEPVALALRARRAPNSTPATQEDDLG